MIEAYLGDAYLEEKHIGRAVRGAAVNEAILEVEGL